MKAEQTCMEHYGVKHAAQSEEIKRKTKEVFVEKYGVDNPMKCQQSKDKIKKTFLDKYGVDHPWKDAEVQEKENKLGWTSTESTIQANATQLNRNIVTLVYNDMA